MSLNTYLFTIINQFAGKNYFLDNVMIFFASFLIIYIPIYLIYEWLFSSKRYALTAFSVAVISFLLANVIHFFYHHPRPFEINYGTNLIKHESNSSFPSEHASVSFAFAFAYIYLKKYKRGVLFFIFAVIISLARVYCGVHFPFDIVGGFFNALISLGIFILLKKYFILFFDFIIKIYEKTLTKVF